MDKSSPSSRGLSSFIQNSRKHGISDDETLEYLGKKDPKIAQFIKSSKDSNFSPQETIDYIYKKSSPFEEAVEQKPVEQSSFGDQVGTAVNSALRVPMQLGVGAVKAAAFPYDIGAHGAAAMQNVSGVQESQLLESVTNDIENMLIQKQNGEWTPQDEEHLKHAQELVADPSKLKQYVQTPPDLSIGGALDRIGDTKPKNAIEETANLVGTLAGAGVGGAKNLAANAVSMASKYLTAPAKEGLKKIVAQLPLASTAVAAKDIFGIPEWASLATMSAAQVAYQGGKQLVKHATKKLGERYFLFNPSKINVKSPVESFQKEASKTVQEARKQFKEGFISKGRYDEVKPFLDTAEKYGIPVTPSTFTDSSRFKRIENLINNNLLTEPAAQKFRQESADKWAKSYLRILDDVSTDARFSTQEGVAESLATNVTRKQHESLKNKYYDLIEKSEQSFKNAKPISKEARNQIQDSIQRVKEKTQSSLIPTSAEQAANVIAKEAQAGKVTLKENITPQELVNTIRSLNNTINWDQPEVVNLFKDTRKVLKNILDKEYASNPGTKFYNEANKSFSEASNTFGKDSRWKKWGLNEKDVLPDELLRTIGNLERFKAFEKDFGNTPEGKHLIDHLKRLKIEKKLAPIFEKGNYTPGNISESLRSLERDPEMMYMLPSEAKKELKSLASLDSQIQRNSSRFYRQPEVNQGMSDLASDAKLLLSPGGWAIKLSNVLSKNTLAKSFSEVFMSPEITKEMKQLGEEILKLQKNQTPKQSQIDFLKSKIKEFWDSQVEEFSAINKAAAATTQKTED